ncbi:MAG: diguanylate cyclase [Pseudomonadota bacterium]|nr:diguanylate cyclase [Pseudomonadota bacterium]
MALIPFGRQSRSLTTHLVFLGLFGVLPLIIGFGATVAHYAGRDREHLLHEGFELNESVLASLRGDHDHQFALMEGLATSPAFTGPLDAERLSRSIASLPEPLSMSVVELDTASVVFTTGSPAQSSSMASAALDEAERMPKTGGRLVSDLLPGPRQVGHRIALSVPVMSDGSPRFLLTAFIPAATIADHLIRMQPEASFFGTVSDANGRIIARTHPDKQMTGEMLPGFRDITAPEGTWSGINPHGVPVYGFWQTDPISGWIVTSGVAKSALEAPMWHSLLLVGVFAGIALSCFGLTALVMWSRLERTIAALKISARQLGEGQRPAAAQLPIREGNAIAQALAKAAEEIDIRDKALFEANKTLEQRVAERTEELKAALLKAEEAEQTARQVGRELARLATTDSLTGLANRRSFDVALQNEITLPDQANNGLSLLIVDVDHFKSINDCCGHHVGDTVLTEIAKVMQSCLLWPGDSAFRLGGEEFAVLLPKTEGMAALVVAERLRQAVESAVFGPLPAGDVTVSIGLATRTWPDETALLLYRRADEALYEAKRGGRNRTVVAHSKPYDVQEANVIVMRAS